MMTYTLNPEMTLWMIQWHCCVQAAANSSEPLLSSSICTAATAVHTLQLGLHSDRAGLNWYGMHDYH